VNIYPDEISDDPCTFIYHVQMSPLSEVNKHD